MTIRVEELEEGPSAMLRSRDERDERRGRRDDRGDRRPRRDNDSKPAEKAAEGENA